MENSKRCHWSLGDVECRGWRPLEGTPSPKGPLGTAEVQGKPRTGDHSSGHRALAGNREQHSTGQGRAGDTRHRGHMGHRTHRTQGRGSRHMGHTAQGTWDTGHMAHRGHRAQGTHGTQGTGDDALCGTQTLGPGNGDTAEGRDTRTGTRDTRTPHQHPGPGQSHRRVGGAAPGHAPLC